MNKQIFIFFILLSTLSMAQVESEKLPFYEIEDYPETYDSNFIVARMIDGLGFRYYWATEGLRDVDLEYKPSESGRNTGETIDHLYGLSRFIRNSILEHNKDETKSELSYNEKRKQTLMNLKMVSDVFKSSKEIFKFEETSVPFWNIINGPISDALWHCGQIVMLRRASGNPFNSKVSVFQGKLKN
ncbi:hypothetical protein [Seonamhaeicola aphaedonensis]|uniref:DinB family protein n=1 Tax=Seonamhaeicola aphaedonensis TaxID=1461338 RepID=A0A3D9H684_9FLAO|nr:hypothetical protein [Seonamhaeicola aphaedonensis]RED44972.1 hypothetical protein DFQ02_10989 [Seonamhaeicola aphaedonensis]